MLRRGRKRIFAASVLPVALYAAEHDGWDMSSIAKLRTAAFAGHGSCPPAVPHVLAAVTLEPAMDPAFRIPVAALERWSREVWMATLPQDERPADTLSGRELYEVQRILQRSPLKARHGPGRRSSTPHGPSSSSGSGRR